MSLIIPEAKYAWIKRLPEFGDSLRFRSLVIESEKIPMQIAQLEQRKLQIEMQIDEMVRSLWSREEIEAAKNLGGTA